MVDTIKRCGTTLLDTIQHVLDFAKINSFTNARNKRAVGEATGKEPQPITMGLNVNIDLTVITEDVIDSTYAGHEFQSKQARNDEGEASGFLLEAFEKQSVYSDLPREQSASKNEGIELIVDIVWRSNWVFNAQPGAMRRILMNLIGNSLKFTEAGWIKISLRSSDIMLTPSQPQQSLIAIAVSDSGRGMSQEFLHNHMFTPFVQEDVMNPGTGLGMSVVLQIVRSLGGKIDVKSEQGVGTEVKVSLTLTQAGLKLPMKGQYESFVSEVREKTSGLTLGLVGFH
jgi:signal transduction histidine kinase